MITALQGVVLGFFVLVSLLDLKFRIVPSVLNTGMIFVVAVINIQNLPYAVLSLILAVLFMDLDVQRGLGDLKAMVVLGFMIPTMQTFFVYIIVLVVIGTIYTLLMRKIAHQRGEFAYLPVFLVVYLSLLFGGVI